jgi:hypothetical protein
MERSIDKEAVGSQTTTARRMLVGRIVVQSVSEIVHRAQVLTVRHRPFAMTDIDQG